MNKKMLSILAGVLGVAVSFGASASKSWCSGKVVNLQLDKNTRLYATFSGTGDKPLRVSDGSLCSLKTSQGENTFCKALHSQLLVALATQQTVTLWFNNNNGQCPTGSWTNLESKGFYHFRLMKG
ncbi:hypothetical protein [Pseudoalteromonas luteoviolacea]|uniref:Uncharacterized protein n=1 Tax=Pseudoalteromonas luteoviolacea S4054 TaxID=1129367 RepID=A0A0F6ACI4_9GAMM|nr:hypothetical protein [Pseudoalteromonas luteoviolacea]AOT09406.1 hypothetical protein S4054249_16795 [Pseudoalteromonas luteoviolacea]AOT14318.1 hypothetical protein S40542_16765 [Pseudoalteromonas luteoviolacea]AOT19234.1 hypothetical protein S4054_16770 [Pseudoalteromonas luteoviolacea]KKE83119.1 hypothetical protein N479_15720 [Pseudoalteromonas luteoviolacea S4054]KZN73510.1 hypothetical protein N481_12385 [Pseudoalteromonas luteoviolacea S4047-1]